MPQMKYEEFLRFAFAIPNNGNMVERRGDPAELADTDVWGDIDKVKIGVGYAIKLYFNEVINNCKVGDTEWTRLESFLSRVISAPTLDDVESVIDEFNTSVVNAYFNIANGLIRINCNGSNSSMPTGEGIDNIV